MTVIVNYKYEPTITVIKVKTMNTLWYDPGSHNADVSVQKFGDR